MPNILTMVDVSKRFQAGVRGCSAHVDALRDVSLTVASGEIIGVLGPTAAGKSTLLLCAAGLLRPSFGEITRSGGLRPACPGGVAYVPERPVYYSFLTVRESLTHYTIAHAVEPSEAEARVERIMCDVLLEEHQAQRVADLPRGVLRRLALAQALIGAPHLLLADETLTGADFGTRRHLRELLFALVTRGTGVVVASSDAEVLGPVATRMVELSAGRVRSVSRSQPPARLGRSFPTPALASDPVRLAGCRMTRATIPRSVDPASMPL